VYYIITEYLLNTCKLGIYILGDLQKGRKDIPLKYTVELVCDEW